MYCSVCKKKIDYDTTNWVMTQDDEKPLPKCSNDRNCVEVVVGRMVRVRELAKRFII